MTIPHASFSNLCTRIVGSLSCALASVAVAAAAQAQSPPSTRSAAFPGAPAAATAEIASISVWTHESATTPEFAVLKEAAETYNRKQRKYRISVYPLDYRHYPQRVQSAAVTGNLPCLLEVDGPYVQTFAWRGYLRSLDRYVSPALLGDFLSSIVVQGTYDGRLYSLGQYESGLALWANRRYLAAAGVRIPTVAVPWTLAEFEQALQRLTALPQVDYALNLAVYTGASEFYSYAYAPIVQGFGGDLINRGASLHAQGILDGPESVAAMKRLQYWFESGWSQAVFDRADDFENGRAALSWTGHWKYLGYRAKLGQDLLLLPLPDFGRGIKTGTGSWSWSISSTCNHPAEAWAFLEHLLSAEQIVRMTDANGAMPARRSVLQRSGAYGARGPLHVFAQQLDAGFAVPRPATPAYFTISAAFATAVSAIIRGADVQTELTRAAQRVDADIATHRGYPPP